MALVYSLLLEDCSSVELKDTPDCGEHKGVGRLYFCGNSADFVEIRDVVMGGTERGFQAVLVILLTKFTFHK